VSADFCVLFICGTSRNWWID